MLWIIIVLLFILWLGALLVAKITGVLIHLLLVAALVIFIGKLLGGRKRV